LEYLDDGDREWHPVLDLNRREIFNIVTAQTVDTQRYTPFAVTVQKLHTITFLGNNKLVVEAVTTLRCLEFEH
jgi:hypothetical protein